MTICIGKYALKCYFLWMRVVRNIPAWFFIKLSKFSAVNIKIKIDRWSSGCKKFRFPGESDLCDFYFRASSHVFLWRTKVHCTVGSLATYWHSPFYSGSIMFHWEMIFSQRDFNSLFFSIFPEVLFPPLCISTVTVALKKCLGTSRILSCDSWHRPTRRSLRYDTRWDPE